MAKSSRKHCRQVTAVTWVIVGALGVRLSAQPVYTVDGPKIVVNTKMVKSVLDVRIIPCVARAWSNPGSYGQATIADIDGDGSPEAFGYSSSGTARGVASDGRTELWRVTGLKAFSQDNHVLCRDLNQDGKYELVAVPGEIVVIDAHSGDVLLRQDFSADVIGSELPWYVGRFSSKDSHDIVVAGISPSTGKTAVASYRLDGMRVWHYTSTAGNGKNGQILRTADVDADGYDEVFLTGSWDGLIALDHDGSLLWRYASQGHADGMVIHDFDEDGELEVVTQPNGCDGSGPISMFDGKSGRIEWSVPDADPQGHIQMIAKGRIRADIPGTQAILSHGIRGFAKVIDASGKVVTFDGMNVIDTHYMGGHIAAADADGDGLDEIFGSTDKIEHHGRYVRAYRGDGTLALHLEMYWSPIQLDHFAVDQWDVNRNGRREVLVQTGPYLMLVEIPGHDATAVRNTLSLRHHVRPGDDVAGSVLLSGRRVMGRHVPPVFGTTVHVGNTAAWNVHAARPPGRNPQR